MFKASLLQPATFALDGGAMFGIIPKPLWEKKIAADDFNRISMALRVVLLQQQDRNILIDTGIGEYHPQKFQEQFKINPRNQGLKSALAAAGLKPSDITDVILTHLHFDHVGGLTDSAGKSLFPNAVLHLHEQHYAYALSPSQRDQGSFQSHYFQPLIEQAKAEGKIHFMQGDEGIVVTVNKDTIEYKTSFGHTPYMIHPIFENYIYLADLVPMSHHVHIPWVMGYDIEPATTTIYKEKFYQTIIARNLKVIFEHDITTWGGEIAHLKDKNKYVLSSAFAGSDESFFPLNF